MNTGNASLLLKKLSVPVLFLIIGLLLIIAGVQQKQNNMFMISAVLMFVGSILSLLYSWGKLKSNLFNIIGIGAGIIAAATLYLSWKSVADTATYTANYNLCRGKAIQNLTDIRYAQKAYAEANGTYAKDWETLVDFVKNGTVPYVVAEGNIPARLITTEERDYLYSDNRAIDNNMSENEAYRLSKSPICPEDLKGFKRDTIQVSLIQTKFKNKSYTESRKVAGFGKFYADSLPYIPFTGGKKMWKMEIKDSVKVGEDFFPAINVIGTLPFSKIEGTKPETLFFGKITTNETAGSWEDE